MDYFGLYNPLQEAAYRRKTGKTSVKKASEDVQEDNSAEVLDDLAAIADVTTGAEPEDSDAEILGDKGGTEVVPRPVGEEDLVEGRHEEDGDDGKGSQEEEVDECASPVQEEQLDSDASSVMEPEMADVDPVEEANVTCGKRKVESSTDTIPSKKMKLLNDGFCLFAGSLNASKTYEEVRDSLENFFTTHDLLAKGIRLDHTRKFAFIDFHTEEDLTKALELNGEKMLDKELRLGKAKVKVKEVAPNGKAAKDARTLFVKNIPYSATKEDLQEIFDQAVSIRFLGGGDEPSKGIAFVEFKTEAIAEKVLAEKQGTEVSGRFIVLDFLGEKSNPIKALTKTLMVNNLAYDIKEKALKKVFKKAVSVRFPKIKGKPRGRALIEFESEDDAKEAMESSQNVEIGGRAVKIDLIQSKTTPDGEQVPSKTLIVFGLAKKTSNDILKSTFEGAIGARVAIDKDTGVSRGFGFVDFESPEESKAAKEAMEDCEIDGCHVTVHFPRRGQGASGASRGKPGGPDCGGRGREGRRGGRRGSGQQKKEVTV